MAPEPPVYRALPETWRSAALDGERGAVLLETSLFRDDDHRSLLFTRAEQVLRADSADDLVGLFHSIEAVLARGKYIAGWFGYECGYHFQGLPQANGAGPLALLGIFDAPAVFNHGERGDAHVRENGTAPTPSVSEGLPFALTLQEPPQVYRTSIEQILQWIGAGETYQVNYTTAASSRYDGSAGDLYSAVAQHQPCSFGAIVRLDPQETILSFSPELFFRVDANRTITTRPMKGTAERGSTAAEDDVRASSLECNEKAHAEHVMIVDLLRNDLGRICEVGSVHVPNLFTVERYRTLLQMTSTVQGRLRADAGWYEIFQALFPCGSVTGAPKHHTMELIRQIEPAPRGVYTGAIGFIAPDGTATFNVAIRTLTLRGGVARMGVGSGIVADSTSDEEYGECLLKMRFVEQASEPLFLFETMRWVGEFPLLPLHFARLRDSAEALGFVLNEEDLLTQLRSRTESWPGEPRRVRLTLARSGEIVLTDAELTPWPTQLRVRLSKIAMRSDDPSLQHKTTFRATYSEEYGRATDDGFDECLFVNERGEITEGCISNLVATIDGTNYTPPCRSGALAGVYRQCLLDRGILHERALLMEDLLRAESVFLCNAVRGVASVASLRISNVTHCFTPASTAPFSLW